VCEAGGGTVKARTGAGPAATVKERRLIMHERGDPMSSGTRRASGGLIAVLVVVTLTACRGHGDLAISNDGPGDVTVVIGDELIVVSSSGGAALLNYGCTPGDVTVRFASGHAVVLPGPVCPDQQIVVRDGMAMLRPAQASNT
jgi:hypothetical protein